ncbi:ferritin-like domain-containing protein [Flavobacterium sp. LS1P3]|jgi:ferritin-like metal-binding protein YciE|uniref:YciE/YciF ferroxidase family protein n=1 Tax=Flavobacterium sp. LS1P3 TaxID=3401720 RepID=UPI003AB04A9A
MKDLKMENQTKGTTDKRIVNQFVPSKTGAATELKELFIDSLKDIYWAESALVNALPKMAANATSAILANNIMEHLEITKNQVIRLEKVFELLGVKAEGKKCEAMTGLLKEGDSILEETIPGAVRDAGIIAASQKIEHYEIASYGTLIAFAKTIGKNDVAKLLTQTLAEEKEADCILNEVALNSVNILATTL